jgi:hypothetical protein
MTLDDYKQKAQEILDGCSDEVKTQLSRIKAENLYPPFLEKITETLQQLIDDGHFFWATCGERTFDEQHALYQKGRRGVAGEHIVTTVDQGQSAHNYALACDFAYDLDPEKPGLQPSWDKDKLEFLACKAEENGLDPGLHWKTFMDGPHVQLGIRALGISPRNQLLAAYKKGGKLAVFEYLDEQNWE